VAKLAAPRSIQKLLGQKLLGSSVVGLVARMALASPFAISGAAKLIDFGGATNEVEGLGFANPALVAASVILTQLVGSALLLTRRFCWLGAGVLAGFTVFATLVAHSFWKFNGPEQGRQMTVFLEHVAIVGGLVLAARFTKASGAPR